MYRSCTSVRLAGIIGLISAPQAVGQPICRPALAFKEVRFSKMKPPTLERKWTAVLSVDAFRCATTSGHFGIVFSRFPGAVRVEARFGGSIGGFLGGRGGGGISAQQHCGVPFPRLKQPPNLVTAAAGLQKAP